MMTTLTTLPEAVPCILGAVNNNDRGSFAIGMLGVALVLVTLVVRSDGLALKLTLPAILLLCSSIWIYRDLTARSEGDAPTHPWVDGLGWSILALVIVWVVRGAAAYLARRSGVAPAGEL